MTPNLRIQLLGEFRLFVNDQALSTMNKPRQQALLAYLLLHRHAPQSRQQIAFAFWPESTEAQAYTNLRKIVFQLRREWPNFEELLVGDAQYLGCRQDACFALDVADLEDVLHTLGNDPTTLAGAVEQIVALYPGELLPTCYDEWLLLLRQALHERVVNALDHALARLEAPDQLQVALPAAEHLLRLDPLHEAAYCHLMRLRALAGDKTGALRVYQECVAMLERELGVAPSVETSALYQEILTQHLEALRLEEPERAGSIVSKAIATAIVHNLPMQLTPFVGREHELDALDELLTSDDMRLITIVGPGGMGKTRLALAAAWRQLAAETRSYANTFVHGVYFVALAPLSEAAQIIPAIATALGFAIDSSGSQTRTPEQQLLDYLREKQMLLVLDNFEHLLEGVVLLTAIRQTAPAVRLLITSREHTRLPGEQLYPIGGLALGKGEHLMGADEPAAVTLFVQGARRLLPELALSQHEMDDVARICRLVEGMPLAIELAAAWMEMLTPAEILHEVRQSLDFLAVERAGAPQRHDSMRAVFDATWQRLSERERGPFAAFSIFRGGFTRQAAHQVAEATLQELSRLAAKCLIQHERAANRYTLHELLRQYGAMRLAEAPSQEQAARDRHSAFYVALLQQWQAQLKGKQQPEALAALDAERENISSAWRWSIAQANLSHLATTMSGVGLYYQLRHLTEEGVGLFKAAAQVLERLGETKMLVQALSWQAAFLLEFQQFRRADPLLARCFDLLDSPPMAQQEVRAERAFVLLQLGILGFAQGNWVNNPYFAQSLALSEEIDDPWNAAQALIGLAEVAIAEGDPGRIAGHLEKAVSYYQKLGSERGLGVALAWLAQAERHLGHIESSMALATEGLAIARRHGDLECIARSLQTIGLAHLRFGEVDRARQPLLEAAQLFAEVGRRREEHIVSLMLCAVDLAAGDYAQAKSEAQHCMDFYGSREDHPEAGAFLTFLGWATLYTGTPEEALALLYKSLGIVEESGGIGDRCWSNVLLAFGEWMAGLSRQARSHCLISLRLLVQYMDPISVDLVLSTSMALLAEGEDPLYALQLYGLLLTIPFCGSAAWWLDTVGAHMEALVARSSKEEVESALGRGKASDLEQTVTELLEKLEGLRWA